MKIIYISDDRPEDVAMFKEFIKKHVKPDGDPNKT